MNITRNSLKQTVSGDNVGITEKHDKYKAYVLPKAVSFWLILISPQKARKCDYSTQRKGENHQKIAPM